MRCSLERLAPHEVPWTELDRRPGRSVFCTSAWLDHLAASQGAEPVVARVLLDGRQVGWFTGAVVRRFGLRVLGSPLPGWGTSYMGIDWDDPADESLHPVALAAVRRWSAELRCAHVEVLVRTDPARLVVPPGMACSVFHSYQRPLVDDDTMLAAMSTNARRNLRRADRRGVTVEEVAPGATDGFAEEYFEQVRHAFARRGTRPAYDVERVRQLVQHVHPSGHLLLLRARTAEGRVAATGISAGLAGATAVFLMGAADPGLLDVRPNEAVMWTAMRTWRDRGAVDLDFGGGGTYKEKFGCTPVESAWVRSAVLPGTELLRSGAQRWGAWLRRRR